jgi:undecaprenyl-diphosphatase
MSYFQAFVLGAMQGLTELFPISSLGHSVILPSLFRWRIDQSSEQFIVFLVATHFATALVLFVFFRKDWMRLLRGFWRSLRARVIADADAKLFWLVVVGTVPAGLLGLLFEDQLKTLFAKPSLVAAVLILNGLLMLAAGRLKIRKNETSADGQAVDAGIARLTFGESLKVGIMQCLALVPGFSRTGATLVGGLGVGLSYEEAARFSFLLATPIIGAAAALKLPELSYRGVQAGPVLFGAMWAGIFAWFSVRFLLKYFKTKSLRPFAIYCILAGVAFSAVFWFFPPL